MEVLADGVGLLERAISYALGSVEAVTQGSLSRPTPCAGWDLRMLLQHVNDSLEVLHNGIDAGCVGLGPPPDGGGELATDLLATFRSRACRLLGAWTAAGHDDRVIAIADQPMLASVLAGAGALDIAVHGWDIARACGRHRPIPSALAIDILKISRVVVMDGDRFPLFAAPVPVSASASPSDRLVAFLGRRP